MFIKCWLLKYRVLLITRCTENVPKANSVGTRMRSMANRMQCIKAGRLFENHIIVQDGITDQKQKQEKEIYR